MQCLNKFLNRIKINLKRSCKSKKIDYYSLQQIIRDDNTVILLDVRSTQEFKEGHLLGATNIPYGELKNKVSYLIPNHGQTIIVYCQMGGRSEKAVNILQKMGYTNIYQLDGGLNAI